MKTIFAILRIVFLLFWIAFMMPALWLVYITRLISPWFNKTYFKVVCFILGIRVNVVKGKISDIKNLLIISNHMSYLDVFVIGSKIKTNFVSRDDAKNWPIFGLVTKLGNTVYISRDRTKAKSQIDLIEKEVVGRKVPLLIFPEGTSHNGSEMLPFKSSIFAMFQNHIGKKQDNPITIQPISIAYTKEGKNKLNAEGRQNYAWYIKEEGLIANLFNAMKHSPFTAEIIIHNTIDISKFKDRKELAVYSHNIVETGFKELIK